MSCNDILADSVIENIYKNVKPITDTQIQTQCVSTDEKKAYVEIFDNSKSMLIRSIERTYFRDKLLWSKDESGKVVKHEYFILHDDYRGQNIAKNIHKRELDAYRSNHFVEIQLEAAWDGLIVWKRLYFKFKSKEDENLIKMAVQRYLKKVKKLSKSEIKEAIKTNPFSIPMHYLQDEAKDFKDWIYEEFPKVGLVKMYKEVS